MNNPHASAIRPQPSAIGRKAASISAFPRFSFSAFIFALFLAFAATTQAQTYYDMSSGNYSQAFTSIAAYPTNFNGVAVDTTGSIPSGTKIVTASTSLAVVSTSTGIQNNTNNLLFLVTGGTDNTGSIACDLNLNFTGRTAGNLTADVATVNNGTGNRVGTLRVYYSLNNSTWTEITGTNLPFAATNNVAGSASLNIALPSAISGQSTVKLRFYYHNGTGGTTGSRPKISLDNVGVSSTAAATAATVTTNSTVTSISTTGATLGGNITNINGANATVRGFEYSTSSGFGNGTGTNSTDSGTYGNGTFTKAVSSLTANTLYYFKAKAQNSAGTGWGAEASFTTLPLPPTVGTGSSPTATGFTANWSLPTMGSATHNFTVEVSTNNSTFASPTTVTGILSGNTSQAITGLSPSTTYYYRIKSVNAQGDSAWSSGSAGIATSAAAGPVLTAATLGSALTSTYPSASSGVSFTAAGTNLTENILVTAQSGYEVSTSSGSGYGASVSVATVTTVYVRFAASRAAGSYNSATAAVLSSAGAANANVTTSISGNTISKATPTVSAAPTASAITYGQTLASSTLSGGTASVAGAFAFTTPATAPSAGTASQGVTFTPTDGTNYNTASTTASVTVNKATPTLVFNSANSTTVNGTVTLNATSASTGAVTFASSNNAVVSIASDVAMGVAIGTATITASQAADSNYNAATANQTMTVTAAPVSLALWNQAWVGTAASPLSANTTATGLTGNVTRIGLGGGSSGSRYSANTWNGSSSSANYLSVTLNATSSYELNLNSSTINATWGSSNTGPASYAVYSSVNSFSAPVGTFASSGTTTVSGTITLPSSGYSNLSSIEFRVVGNATSANGGSTVSSGTGGFSYLQFTGIIAQNPPTVEAATINGTVGTALSANITATNSPASYAISSGTLPAGLSLNATTGVISGTPTAAVSSSVVAVTATNGGGTSASADLTFNIAAIAPTIGSPTVSSVATTSATLGATVTANGGATLSARGTTWGTSASPTGNSLAEGNTTVSAFTHSRTGLTANTLYYYRGYATNSNSTVYTADGNFTTLPLAPTVGTGSVATTSGFTASWTAPTMGGASYTYTVEVDNDSNFGSIDATVASISSGSTTQAITSLSSSTTYYYRVKSVNTTGSSAYSSTSAGIATSAASGTISTSGTLSAFTATYPSASAEQSFSVSGTGLTGSLTVTPPAGFEVSLTSGSAYGASATISANGTLASTTVYVRLPASATPGSYSGNVAVSGGSAATQNVAASGTVSQASQTITFGALDTKNATDADFALAATASSNLTVSYASSNTSVATVAGNTVTLVGGGSTTITASQAGNTNYAAAASVTQTLTVNKVAQTISGVTSTLSKTYGDATYSLGATVGSGLAITYASSNASVATIAANGTVTIVAPGTTTLTASQAGDARYSAAASATQSLTVGKATPTLVFNSSNSTTVNATVTLNATSASTGAVTFTSSNNAVVSIASGVATGLAIGTATITASQAADSNYNAASANQTMTVTATPSVIFSENMGIPSGTTAISAHTFQNNGTLTFGNGSQASPADVRTTSTSSGYTGSSGTGNVFFSSSSGNYGFSIESINVSNYSNLTLRFGYLKDSASVHAAFSVDYWDGSAWQTIANSSANLFNQAANAATGWYLSKSLSLPPGANINGLKIRFVKSGTASIRIDDVQLLGSIALCEAPVLSRATLPVAGGFTVNWSAVTGAGNYTVLHSASKNMTGATSVNTASTSVAITGLSNGLRYVQVRANNTAGASANSTQQVNQLQSIAAGATSYLSAPGEVGTNTVAGIFGSANEAGLASGATDSASTTILLLNSNGATANTIFYNSSVNQWREGATAMDTTAIAQGKAFMLKNNTGSTDYFLLVGSPRTTQPVVSLNPAGNYTLCTTGRTTPTTLTNMNLNPGSGAGAFKTASKAKDADKVIVVDQATGAATNYYHNGTNWMDGLRAVPAAEIPAGQGFFIKKASDSTFSSWTLPAE